MAFSVTANLVTISSADSTTGWSGNAIGTSTDIKKEGTASVSDQNSVNTDDILYTPSSPLNLSGRHVRVWFATIVFGYWSAANDGIYFIMKDGSGNVATWFIAGKSDYSGGWLNIVVYADSTPTSGSVNPSNVTSLGVRVVSASKPRRIENTWIDYLRYGDGLIVTGSGSFEDVVLADLNRGWGIVEKNQGIYFLYGSIQFGNVGVSTIVNEVGKVFSFANANVSPSLYKIVLYDDTGNSSFTFDGCVFTTAGPSFLLDFDNIGSSTLTFTGNTVQKANKVYFLGNYAKCNVSGNVFDGCGEIYPQGCKFENNKIVNTRATTGAVVFSSASEVLSAKNLQFQNYAGKNAVYLTAGVTGSITLDNWQFDRSGTDIYWAGTSGVLNVYLTNGSNAKTWNSAGGTVNFIASVSLEVVGIPENVEIRIIKADDLTELAGAEDHTSPGMTYLYTKEGVNYYKFTYSYNAAQLGGTPVVIRLVGLGYEVEEISYTLPSVNSSIPVELRRDRWYHNP